MIRRSLGRTGIQVGPLGLGTVKLGRDRGVKYPRRFRIPDDREAANLLARARDLGINLLDTAPAYGESEARLGRLLTGWRDAWVLCSKVGEEFADGVSSFDFSAAHARASVERSLRRLRTDRLDLVLVHSDGRDREILADQDLFAELLRMKREGLVRAVGMSTKTPEGGLAALAVCDVVMVTYNLDHTVDAPVLAKAADEGVAVLVKKPLGSGRLEGVHRAIAFVFGHPGVSAAVVGTIDPDHLAEDQAAVEAVLGEGTGGPLEGGRN